jgi:NAD(P)H dehydrogenase (quinone)
MSLIAVTGATGGFGRHALNVLAGRGVAARALPRATADYDDPASLRAGLDGVTRLLFVSSPELDPARRTAQHRAVVTAARDSGVEIVVYTSFHELPGLFDAHAATEQALRESGLAFTALRNPFYSDPFLEAAHAAAELVHATAGRPLNTATRADLAEAAVSALLADDHTGTARTLTGPPWTYPALAAHLGKPHREAPIPGPMGWLHSLAAAGKLSPQTPDLTHLLGRQPTPML